MTLISDCGNGTVYDDECPICTGVINKKTRDENNIVTDYGNFVVAINPRFSPHPYRTAIVPIGHMCNTGKYGFAGLYPDDWGSYNHLREKVTRAIVNVCETKKLKLKQREGFPLIDCIERPSVHPSADIFPTYVETPVVHGVRFPKYGSVMVDMGENEIFETEPILASFPKQAFNIEMPVDLRRKIAGDLRVEFEKLKII